MSRCAPRLGTPAARTKLALLLLAFGLLVCASPAAAKPSNKLTITTPRPAEVVSGTIELRTTLKRTINSATIRYYVDAINVGAVRTRSRRVTRKLNTCGFLDGRHTISIQARTRGRSGTSTSKATARVRVANGHDSCGNTLAASGTPQPLAPIDSTAPSAPTNFVISAINRTALELTWDPSNDDSGSVTYDVYQGDALLGTTDETFFPVGLLTCATGYQFTVVARDPSGNSAATPTASIVTLACADLAPPAPVTGLAASAVTQTSLELSWQPTTDASGIAGYEVLVGGESIGYTNALSLAIDDLDCGAVHPLTVVAYDEAGNSSASVPLEVSTEACVDDQAPTAPADLSASDITETSASITWTASTDNVGVVAYDVYRNGRRIRVTTNPSSDAGVLLCDTTYTFMIFARDASGNRAGSAFSFTTAPCTVPNLPGPSGVAMPTDDLTDWKLIFAEDFLVDAPLGSLGSATDPNKIVYTGAGGTKWVTYPANFLDTYQKRPYRSDQVLSVQDGTLDFWLHNVDGQPAGANPSPIVAGTSQYQTYGRYSARMRVENTDLSEYYIAWLLWPANHGDWAIAESDFPEGSLAPGKQGVRGFSHFGQGQQEAFSDPRVDLHEWHTYTQEWTPTARRYYVDDQLIHTTSHPVYSGPQRWQLQTETNGFGDSSGHLLVDWAVVYSYTPAF